MLQLICKSRVYQLSIETNPFNEDDLLNYSHARARRLPAEVLFDSIHGQYSPKFDRNLATILRDLLIPDPVPLGFWQWNATGDALTYALSAVPLFPS